MANQVSWFEISGKDGRKLQEFSSDLFGWKIDANNPMSYGMVEGSTVESAAASARARTALRT
jgi:predicted enzyme related to lactoylglutathione lyase